MEIKTIEISGFISTLKALRLPFGLECRSYTDFVHSTTNDSKDCIISSYKIDRRDLCLMKSLVKSGPEHAKCIRGINVYTQIKAPVYWWCEMEQYNIGRTRLVSESTMHIDCKGLSGKELQDAKAAIPMGKELTKIDCFNYQCLRNIYFQRKNHRLQEWHQFCEWIETLPYAEELITIQ